MTTDDKKAPPVDDRKPPPPLDPVALILARQNPDGFRARIDGAIEYLSRAKPRGIGAPVLREDTTARMGVPYLLDLPIVLHDDGMPLDAKEDGPACWRPDRAEPLHPGGPAWQVVSARGDVWDGLGFTKNLRYADREDAQRVADNLNRDDVRPDPDRLIERSHLASEVRRDVLAALQVNHPLRLTSDGGD